MKRVQTPSQLRFPTYDPRRGGDGWVGGGAGSRAMGLEPSKPGNPA